MSSITDTAPIPASRTTEGQPRGKRRSRSGPVPTLVAWLVGLLFVLPVLGMLLTSLHSEPDAATNPPSLAAQLTCRDTRSSSAREPGPARGGRRRTR